MDCGKDLRLEIPGSCNILGFGFGVPSVSGFSFLDIRSVPGGSQCCKVDWKLLSWRRTSLLPSVGCCFMLEVWGTISAITFPVHHCIPGNAEHRCVPICPSSRRLWHHLGSSGCWQASLDLCRSGIPLLHGHTRLCISSLIPQRTSSTWPACLQLFCRETSERWTWHCLPPISKAGLSDECPSGPPLSAPAQPLPSWSHGMLCCLRL